MVQWLGLCTFTDEDLGSIACQGTKNLQATRQPKKKKGGKSKALCEARQEKGHEGKNLSLG